MVFGVIDRVAVTIRIIPAGYHIPSRNANNLHRPLHMQITTAGSTTWHLRRHHRQTIVPLVLKMIRRPVPILPNTLYKLKVSGVSRRNPKPESKMHDQKPTRRLIYHPVLLRKTFLHIAIVRLCDVFGPRMRLPR